MVNLLLEHHHVLGEDAVSQLHLHGPQLLHVVGPVRQRLLQLLHGKAPGTSLGTKLLWFPNLLVNPLPGLWGRRGGECAAACAALSGWAGWGPRVLGSGPDWEPTGAQGRAAADSLVQQPPPLHPKVSKGCLSPCSSPCCRAAFGVSQPGRNMPNPLGFLFFFSYYFGHVAFHLHLFRFQVIYLNAKKNKIGLL